MANRDPSPLVQRRTFITALAACTVVAHTGRAMTCTALDPTWEYVADTVMGGVSTGGIAPDGQGMRLAGTVSLENNGGFIQMATPMGSGAAPFDASGFSGLRFRARGNGETYAVNLRTTELSRPWQSYRANFTPAAEWGEVTLPFSAFEPSNTDVPLNPAKLRRIGVIAVGRAMQADVSVADLCLIS